MGSKVRSAVEFSRGLGCYSKGERAMPEIGLWVLGIDDVAAPVSSFTFDLRRASISAAPLSGWPVRDAQSSNILSAQIEVTTPPTEVPWS